MADRSIVVRLKAEVADFKRGMAEATSAADKASASFDKNGQRIQTLSGRIVRSAQIHSEEWRTAGAALTTFGTLGAAALGMTTKAAMDWESAWAGVLKTVDGSAEELAQLESALRGLAMVKPASHAEIAAVAEAAGQLGVATKDVAAFTAVMVDLGETTNLTADEAATSIAQLMNVMQTAPEDVDRLGAALVALGNNGASTERDIIQMAQRIAGAARPIGLTEAQVLGLANALASVGIEVEAGGSAISNIMIDISRAVSAGGDKLQQWAKVAGMTSEDFAKAWKEAPAEALATLIEGMGQLNAKGEDVFATLSDLGQTDVRVTRALLSMANSGDLLRDSLELGNQAWRDNAALVEEAMKRYDTTEAKVQIARNAMNEAAIEIGEHLLPILADLAQDLASVAQWFANLPEPVQRSIAMVGGFASVAMLGAGALLVFVPKVLETVAAFRKLNTIAPGVVSKIGSVGGAFAAVAAAVGVSGTMMADWNNSLVQTSKGAGQAVRDLLLISDAGYSVEQAFAEMFSASQYLKDVDDAIQILTAPSNSRKINDWIGSIFGSGDFETMQAKEFFRTVDEGLTSLLASGQHERAAAVVRELGVNAEQAAQLLPGYSDALADAENQTKFNAEATSGLNAEMVTYGQALEEAIKLQREHAGVALSEWDAVTQFAEAVQTATEALYNESGALVEANRTLDANTEAGRRNRDALADIVDATWDWVESGAKAGESQMELTSRVSEGREAFIRTAEQMGLTREEAEALADQFGLIPAKVTTIVTADTSQARRAISELRGLMNQAQWDRYDQARTGYATGGPVVGPGSGTSDSIPALLSNGEHVWTAREVAAAGGHAAVIALRRAAVRGYANGGPVGYAPAAPVVNVNPSLGDVLAGFSDGQVAQLASAIVSAARTTQQQSLSALAGELSLANRQGGLV